MSPVLPYALAFAAGVMIFVVVEELIPESQRAGNGDLSTARLTLGFACDIGVPLNFILHRPSARI